MVLHVYIEPLITFYMVSCMVYNISICHPLISYLICIKIVCFWKPEYFLFKKEKRKRNEEKNQKKGKKEEKTCQCYIQLKVYHHHHHHHHHHFIWSKEGNVLFNDALNTFYLLLYGVTHMVKDHSDSERGSPLPPHRLLFPINSKGYFICTIPQRG